MGHRKAPDVFYYVHIDANLDLLVNCTCDSFFECECRDEGLVSNADSNSDSRNDSTSRTSIITRETENETAASNSETSPNNSTIILEESEEPETKKIKKEP